MLTTTQLELKFWFQVKTQVILTNEQDKRSYYVLFTDYAEYFHIDSVILMAGRGIIES